VHGDRFRGCKELALKVTLSEVSFSSIDYRHRFVDLHDETWFLVIRGERRLKMSDNGVLRSVFGPKRKEVTGEWKKIA
jgi:hypothetical protein